MGLGMQIVYLGFAGSSAIEAEAGIQLLRLERYAGVLTACLLAIELLQAEGGRADYDVRLDLLSTLSEFKPDCRCTSDDPLAAMRVAFDAAERELALAAAAGHGAGNRRTRFNP